MKTALFNGELQYYVQPVWDIVAGEIHGFEALIRWHRADGSVVLPNLFVPLLYEVTRDRHCLQQKYKLRGDALSALREFPDAYVSFNFTLDQLGVPGAARSIISNFSKETDHPDRKIKIELSEHALHDRIHAEVLRRELMTLKAAGFNIALDDFGVESSNLNRLQEYPIDTVKLDKTLIDRIETDVRQRILVQGLTRTMTEMGVKVIAEGVEYYQQAALLKAICVRYHQGYLHAKPMPPGDVAAQLGSIGKPCGECDKVVPFMTTDKK